MYTCIIWRDTHGYIHEDTSRDTCMYVPTVVPRCAHTQKRVHAPNMQSKTMKMLLDFFLLGTPDSLRITPLLGVVSKG